MAVGERLPQIKLWKNLCKLHNLNEKKVKKLRNIKIKNEEVRKFYKNLHKFGYAKFDSSKEKRKNFLLVNAFQRRFRQTLINGKIDKECLMISENLLNK